jgi:hypothetical protein
MKRLVLLVTAIAGTPSASNADAVADEVSAGTTLATSTAPGSSWIANRLGAVWDVDDSFTLQVDFAVTRSSSTSTTGSLSLSYAASDHWSLGVAASWVPASSSSSTATLVIEELEDDVILADAELVATTSSTSLAVSAGYDTAGDSDHETSVSLTLGVDHVQSQQAFGSIVDDLGMPLSIDDVRDYCADVVCDPEIEAALSPLWSQLSRFSINASVVQTEYRNIDLGLDATYYLYDKDPIEAGYFRLPGLGPSNLGNGVAIAPLRYAVSPTVASKWGRLQGTLGVAYGSYLSAQGYELGANLKVQYKLPLGDHALRLYSSLASSWNVDVVNDLTTSLSLALGGKYTW